MAAANLVYGGSSMTLKGMEESRRVIEIVQPAVNQAGYDITGFDLREVRGYINAAPTDDYTVQITINIMPLKYAKGAGFRSS
jgi:hypothetical protein